MQSNLIAVAYGERVAVGQRLLAHALALEYQPVCAALVYDDNAPSSCVISA